jgi:hypothetical protein
VLLRHPQAFAFLLDSTPEDGINLPDVFDLKAADGERVFELGLGLSDAGNMGF